MDFKEKIAEYFSKLKSTIDKVSIEDLNTLMNVLVQSKEIGSTIFIMGNGGSSATASHFVCDFNKGISFNQDKKFKFICLNDNIPSIMAYANDMSFEEIFVQQLKNYFQKGDVVIGISGSGNSMNVVKAIEYANENGGISVGLTGYDGGKLKKLAKYNINVPIDDMQITEDVHMVLDHCMMKILSSMSNYLEMGKDNPLISVVMPSYNSAKYISKTIESILNQTISDFEFIIIDGCSTDNTDQIIKSYSELDSRIIYKRYYKDGIGEALKFGCQLAKGKFIARIDSDDISLPYRFEKQIDIFQKNESIILATSAVYYINERGDVLGQSFPYSLNYLMKKNVSVISHPAVMMLKNKYHEAGGYLGLIRAEDYFLWSKMSLLGDFYMSKEPLLKYRLHSNSLSYGLDNKFNNMLKRKLNQLLEKENINAADIQSINAIIKNNIPLKKEKIESFHIGIEMKLNKILKKFIGEKVSTNIVFFMKNIYGIISMRNI